MNLQHLEATDFRNLSGAIEFAPGLNILYGDNAQGKSSWLEAIYLLATTKSFRTVHPREMMRHGAREGILRGVVARGNLLKELQLLIVESSKQTFVSGKRESVVRYLGTLDAIAFTADELEIVRGSPEARRRFLDRGIVATLPSFLGTISEYNRVLKQKNRLLRDASESDDPSAAIRMIEVWNDQLAVLGTDIHQARLSYVEKLQRVLQPKLFRNEAMSIRYQSSLEEHGNLDRYEELLRERLAVRLRNEVAAGHALVGPHRDELEIWGDGFDVATFGSSGQQRSALLVLDLAQMLVYYEVYDEYPVFLIDDIDAELDRRRIDILLEYLGEKSQTIVSTSKRTLADRYSDRAAVRLIVSGSARPDELASASPGQSAPDPSEIDQSNLEENESAASDELQYEAPF
jgi:DNA replication and repair protein RecF